MSVLIYLWAKATFQTNFSNDVQMVCLLAAIEYPQLLRIAIHLWRNR